MFGCWKQRRPRCLQLSREIFFRSDRNDSLMLEKSLKNLPLSHFDPRIFSKDHFRTIVTLDDSVAVFLRYFHDRFALRRWSSSSSRRTEHETFPPCVPFASFLVCTSAPVPVAATVLSLPCRGRRIRAGSCDRVVVLGGRGNRCGGASDLDRFRAGNRWPARNPLAVSRQVSLVLRAVLGLLQRLLQLVDQSVVELVQGARAAGFRRRRAGALARALQGTLRRPRGGPREVARGEGHRTVSRGRQEVRAWRRGQRRALGFRAFRHL